MTLLDSGPLVALMNPRDQHHGWAQSAFDQVRLPLATCQAVLTETFFLLRAHPIALARLHRHVRAGHFLDRLDFCELAPRILTLMERYANVPMSFADGCLVALAEATPGARIFTLDRDFLIYRGESSEPLALLAPFAQ